MLTGGGHQLVVKGERGAGRVGGEVRAKLAGVHRVVSVVANDLGIGLAGEHVAFRGGVGPGDVDALEEELFAVGGLRLWVKLGRSGLESHCTEQAKRKSFEELDGLAVGFCVHESGVALAWTGCS